MDAAVSSPLLAPALPARTPSNDDRPFSAPWEAKAFAIVVELAQAGHFTWAEWVVCFSAEVAAAAAVEAAGGWSLVYYEQWLNAAESMLVGKGLTSQAQLRARRFAIGAAGVGHVLK